MLRRDPVSIDSTSYRDLNRVLPDRLIFSKLKAFEGAIAVTPIDLPTSYASNEFPTFRCTEQILPSYLRLVTRQPAMWESMSSLSKGIGGRRERLHPTDFLALPLLLPPLDEQHRIVDLAAALDDVHDASESAIHTLRNSYLTLLKAEFSAVARTAPFVPLSSVSTARLGKMLNKAMKTGTGEYPYVRNANVQWDRIDLRELHTMFFTEAERKEFSLRRGDVLVCEGGEAGRTAVMDADVDGVFFQKAIHRVRCSPSLLPRYLMHFMRYSASSGGLADLSSSLTISHLTGEKLRTLAIPVPDITVQGELVSLLDSLCETVRLTEAHQRQSDRVRSHVVAALLSGEHEISATYDEMLKVVA
ncbi:MAG TPA: restriction endonuclease subunit S [Ilumatobacteraceae bacterium]|nr:restriction endonuclease subunit S [Ilumatobacteraceae bacterium]